MAKDKDNTHPLPGISQCRVALQFEFLVHRYGLYVLLIIITAALAGVFSVGYFSQAEKSSQANTLQVQYQRFGRLQTPVTMKITLPGQKSERLTLRIGDEYMTRFETDNIWPQPTEMRSEGGDLILIYHEGTLRKNFTVWLYTTPTQPGKAVTSVTLNNEPDLRFWQFIYP